MCWVVFSWDLPVFIFTDDGISNEPRQKFLSIWAKKGKGSFGGRGDIP